MQEKSKSFLMQLKLLHEKNEYQKYLVSCCVEEIANMSKNATKELKAAAEGKFYFFSAPAYEKKYCRITDVLVDAFTQEIRLKVVYISSDDCCGVGSVPLSIFAEYAKEITKEEFTTKTNEYIDHISKLLNG